MAGLGKARQAWLGMARRGSTRLGAAGQGRRGMARLGQARLGAARQARQFTTKGEINVDRGVRKRLLELA